MPAAAIACTGRVIAEPGEEHGPEDEHPDDDERECIDKSHDKQFQPVDKEGPPLVHFRCRVCPPVHPHDIPVERETEAEDCQDQFQPAVHVSQDALLGIRKGIAEHSLKIHVFTCDSRAVRSMCRPALSRCNITSYR